SREGVYSLRPELRSEIQRRMSDAAGLEERVRNTYVDDVSRVIPDLDPEAAWCAFQAYVSRVFRQHGLHTLALIDPSIEVPPAFETNLRGMLVEATREHCPVEHREALVNLIDAFFIGISSHPDRVAYIVQIADSLV